LSAGPNVVGSNQDEFRSQGFWFTPPPRIPGTTRFFGTFLVDPDKPSFAIVTGCGVDPINDGVKKKMNLN